MSEAALECLKAHRRGYRGVVMKYVQEAKSLMETEELDEKHRLRMGTLSELLKEKSTILKTLDEEILPTCPTNEIEQEMRISLSKIAEMHVEIDSRSQGKTKKISGKSCDETVVHVVSNKDILIKNMSCNEPKAHNKKGAPAVPKT